LAGVHAWHVHLFGNLGDSAVGDGSAAGGHFIGWLYGAPSDRVEVGEWGHDLEFDDNMIAQGVSDMFISQCAATSDIWCFS